MAIGNLIRTGLVAGLALFAAYQAVPLVAGSFMHAWGVSSEIEAKNERMRIAVREETFQTVCPRYRDQAYWFQKWTHHLNWCEDYLDRLPPS